MGFTASTNVRDLVVLVDDKNHERYGQIGILECHYWRESGTYGIRFSKEGSIETFTDSDKDNPPCSVSIYYRHRNSIGVEFDRENTGPAHFVKRWMECNSDRPLQSLVSNYRDLFEEEF